MAFPRLEPRAGRYDFQDQTLDDFRRAVGREFADTHPHGHLRHDPHTVGTNYETVVLDTYLASSAEPASGRFGFDFGVGTTSSISVHFPIERVFMLEVSPFSIPLPAPSALLPADANGLTFAVNTSDPTVGTNALTNPLTQLPADGRVVLNFTNINQGSYGYGARRHHFEFTTTISGDRLLLTPVRCRCIFTEPISEITSLNFELRNPDAPLVLPTDKVSGITIATVGDTVVLSGSIGSLLSAGDRIHFTGAATSNGHLNNALNRSEGHLVGAAGLTTTSFRLNPDIKVTGAGDADFASSTVVVLRIAKNRVRVPLQIRGITDRHTNYIMPTTS